MSLTLANLRALAQHILGGAPGSIITSSTATGNLFVNEAGRRLCMAHTWKWLERPPTALSLTSGQAYIDLPASFGHLIAYRLANTIGRPFVLSTFAGVAEARTDFVSSLGEYRGVIVQPDQSSASAAMGVPRIEISPTPSATVASALSIWYRAKWTELSSDSDIANVPLWIEPLLTQFVRAVAKGYEEEDIDDRIDRVLGGGTFAQAVDHDGQIQPDYGPLEGGAVGPVSTSGYVPFDTIPNP